MKAQGPKLHLRPATLDDAKVLFAWRNDLDTRQNSRHAAEVRWDDHLAWLTRTVNGEVPGRLLYVAVDTDGHLIGTVRADEEGGVTEVSYTIAPEWRGHGLGKTMVLQFVQERLPGRRIKATIKKGGNESSEGIARALGLSPVSEEPSSDPNDPRPLVEWSTRT